MMSPGDKLAGFAGQSMGGPKTRSQIGLGAVDTNAGAVTSFTATTDCTVTLYAWGQGAGGNASPTNGGAGGAAAGRKTFAMRSGQTVSWTYGTTAPTTGTSGQDTVVTLPDGTVLTAGAGKTSATSAGGLGGVPSGPWDLGRIGGAGGASGLDGLAGQFGGAGGAHSGASAGGGGAGGFSDTPTSGLAAGAGGVGGTTTGSAPGGGGGNSQSGSNGRVSLLITQQ